MTLFPCSHHCGSVLCVTINHAETFVISGSEAGAICVVNIRSGQLITRLEHHRGMVTCVHINAGDDVLVSGSTDRTVVVWSLETFCILNEMLLMRPVLHMDISLDSTFLLLSLDDNSLQVRALTTGTAVHALQPSSLASMHQSTQHSSGSSFASSVISYVSFAEDNCRAVVGYADGRLVIFEVHSARQLQTLNGHTEMITAVLPQKNDHFLVTCGGNKIIIWNFYPVKRVDHVFSEPEGEGMQSTSPLTSTGHAMEFPDNLTNVATAHSTTYTAVSKDDQQTSKGNASGSEKSGSGRGSRSSSDRRKNKSSGSFKKKSSIASVDNHREPITCVAVSRDGVYLVSGGRDCLVKIWHTLNGETHTTLDEQHSSPVTCVDIAPNSQFVVSGSDDGCVRTWSITLSMVLSSFLEHQGASIVAIKIMTDSKRVLTADSNNVHRLWQADTGTQLKCVLNKSINQLTLHGNVVMAISGKFDNWSVHHQCMNQFIYKLCFCCFQPQILASVRK